LKVLPGSKFPRLEKTEDPRADFIRKHLTEEISPSILQKMVDYCKEISILQQAERQYLDDDDFLKKIAELDEKSTQKVVAAMAQTNSVMASAMLNSALLQDPYFVKRTYQQLCQEQQREEKQQPRSRKHKHSANDAEDLEEDHGDYKKKKPKNSVTTNDNKTDATSTRAVRRSLRNQKI
jgi:hypothetical protein